MRTKETKNMDEIIDKACKTIAELVKAEDADRARGRGCEAGKSLKARIREVQDNAIESKRLVLNTCEALSDIFDDDILEQLKVTQDCIEGDVSELNKSGDNSEQESNEEEIRDAQSPNISLIVEAIKELLEGFTPPIARDALRAAIATLPECERKHEESMGEGYKGSVDFVVKNVERIFDTFSPPLHRDVLRILMDRLPERERRDKEEDTRGELFDELLNDVLGDVDTPTLASFVKEAKNSGKLRRIA